MALITEDGSGVAGAESLCSVAVADAYHAARGNTAWAALTTTAKEQALIKATDYMQQKYRPMWAGLRRYSTQALDWPRVEVPRRDIGDYYPIDIVPIEVQHACADLASRSSGGTVLLADQSREVVEQTVGPITTKYSQGSSPSKKFVAVDAMVAMFMKAGSGSSLMTLIRS